MKGHDEVHQTLIMPRLTTKAYLSREIFAVWTPYFNGEAFSKNSMNSSFFTDAQGFELMKRKVFDDNDGVEFAASFYPVDSLISVQNNAGNRALTVWNDRPQAGSVHSNEQSGGIKLLVDRRISTNDKGGVPEVLYHRQKSDLVTNFRFKMHNHQSAEKVLRRHKLLAVKVDDDFSVSNVARNNPKFTEMNKNLKTQL